MKNPTHFSRNSRASVTRVQWWWSSLARISSLRWLLPGLALLLLLPIGYWVFHRVESAARMQLADELQTILRTDVAAMEIWFETQKTTVQSLATDPELRAIVDRILDDSKTLADDELAMAASAEEFRDVIQPTLVARRYPGYMLLDMNARLIASERPEAVGQSLEGDYQALVKRVAEKGPTLYRPFASTIPLRVAGGELAAGLPVMFAACDVRNPTGDVVAVLALRIRPEVEFSRILQTAWVGETGETYAFDAKGTLVSKSRFDEELIRVGLLADKPGATSVLNVDLRDPGVDMPAGKQPSERRSAQPLTKMAASAIAGETSFDVNGYRDFRGVDVVGAWTWLPEYEIGLATEISLREAFKPLYILRAIFGGLFGLVTLAMIAAVIFSFAVSHFQRAAQKATLAAKQLGQYQLEEKLGEGGMGVVYKGQHKMLRRATAIKLLHTSRNTEDAIRRFEREVQLTCQLNHPNTIAIFDYGRTPDGIFYYAMEFLDGMDLEQLVTRYGAQPDGRVLSIMKQICGSLAEAHGVGLVHRDIKPANIYLCRRGGICDFIKVLDFGLVKAVDGSRESNITAAGAVTGTPAYMAPESIDEPEHPDPRSDLYAVGAVAYFLLTGAPVFSGRSVVEICMHHAKTIPQPPSLCSKQSISPMLEAVVLNLLAKKPEERVSSASELLELLEKIVPEHPFSAADASAWWKSQQLPAATLEMKTTEIGAEQTIVVK
ncbi:serine/threonine protein kinase [Pirellula staleyi DSM 6068]|uniref:Serine/threonine protein kinase n=1 Tax=Pirellula staleyi (strain ATCC 27377 / DSM 6068 / ICPB 4128) TaxID=530564 RepID=D2QX77_PIRSD|nr:serine/threonine protein kinase [Pirellula staleyi]ADB17917.1 serine/threonine protein kinase [Pirellula staleyi DSM 6068]